MKNKIIFTVFAITCIANSFAQKNKLSFELGYGKNLFLMTDLNRYYIDSFAVDKRILEGHIKSGFNGYVNIKYQPFSLFDFGIYGNYQSGKSSHTYQDTVFDLFFGDQVHERISTFKVEAIGIGITNSWYLSHLLKFKNKNSAFLQRFKIAAELNGGVGFSQCNLEILSQTLFITYYDFIYSTDFQSQIALKFEYDYVKKPIKSTLGFKVGYQFFKTKVVKNGIDQEWVVVEKYPISIDFSGYFGSVYLNIGK